MLDGHSRDSVNSARAFMKFFLFNLGHFRCWNRSIWISLASLSLLLSMSCREPHQVTIAVIPRTSGSLLWEPAHRGAQDAAEEIGAQIYWNAPTREDDVAGQIALIEHVVAGDYQGLVLAPNQSLALITPVRRALAHGLPLVIISSPLPVPAGNNLSYILNDEEEGGRIAARRVAQLLHGRGTIAILGIDPDVKGIMLRVESFERYLAQNEPDIHIIERHTGSFNVPHEQEVAEEALAAHPDLDAIVTLMWPSARGAMSTIDNNPGRFKAKVLSFDPEDLSFSSPSLDSVVVQNTRMMGNLAVKLIHAKLSGKAIPAITTLEPVLITRANANSEEIRHMTTMDWNPGWNLSHTP
ncbi:substrate-binding domain-containing protein [Edaphobacter dinghuensis]|uniref:ABC transporter substrate-binding protein n=2 Tax=Edaphobacter dinghuensis TaxID=1560005 RepID=A0A917HM07_9BACT|nr:substrate-binding domain-containing protein [Edaphobacter dinghuensis]GGG83763.1 ABC transporter substrate-binding protein [Edaphobacter dinghuensis]